MFFNFRSGGTQGIRQLCCWEHGDVPAVVRRAALAVPTPHVGLVLGLPPCGAKWSHDDSV